MHDHLGKQRIESGAGAVSGVAEAVGAHSRPVRRLVDAQRTAGRSHGAIRTDRLHVHPGLDGTAAWPGDARIVEPELGQRGAFGEADLRLHQIDAGDLLGNGVFHLQPCVGLDEHEGTRAFAVRVIDQELECAQIAVAFLGRETNCRFDDPGSEFTGEGWRWSHLDQLLVAALNAAFALAEVCNRPGAVTDDLHLDVAGAWQKLLDVDVFQSERCPGLRLTALERGIEIRGLRDGASAAPTAAGDGLDDHRPTRTQRLEELPRRLPCCRLVQPLEHRHLRSDGGGAGAGFVPEQLEVLDVRTDEGDARVGTASSKIRALGQEAVAGVDRVTARRLRGSDDLVPVEVGARTEAGKRVGFVRDPRVQACRVVLGTGGDGAQSEIGSGTGDADCDFPAIADEQSAEAHGPSSVN